jgi:hypothetical protein
MSEKGDGGGNDKAGAGPDNVLVQQLIPDCKFKVTEARLLEGDSSDG